MMQIIKETLLLILIVFNISCVSNKSNLNNLDLHKEFIDNYIIDSLENDEQERGGFFSTYNKIYVIKDDNIIYANYVTDNSIKDITNFIKKL